ncbi:MAG: glycerophosphodiester phosphodiesterase family protein [Planctomycetaceae bacterium]
MKVLLISISSALLFCSIITQADEPRASIQVVAHRAYHVSAPENTIPAIEAAIQIGCDFVELDVRTSKDGKLIIMHDSSVDRTTDGQGKIDQLTFSEIKKLDAGIKRGEKWKGTEVPTFSEALDCCTGRIGLYLDHKNADVPQVVALLKEKQMLKSTIIYCGSTAILKEYRQLAPDLRIMTGHPDSEAKLRDLMKSLKPETLDGNLRDWSASQANLARELGAELWVDCLGDTDDEASWQSALDLQVTAIQSDKPAELIEFLKSKGLR